MSENQSIQEFTGKAGQEISKVIEEVKPELVLVHGDTTQLCVRRWLPFLRVTKLATLKQVFELLT